jgi:uncharacterized protein YbjT (DUF2867 family)
MKKSTGSNPLILVVGGTGTQGGNVARELLSHGHRVRILTRNPDSDAARLLENAGAEIMRGDMSKPSSLEPVMAGVAAVFSVQYFDPADETVEKRNAAALIQAAAKTGVRQLVHTSATGSDKFPRWSKRKSLIKYWEQKWEIEEYVRHGGFESWTILHPSWFMENLTEPLALFMNPELKNGIIFSSLKPDTRVDLSCGEDLAAFARSALEYPERFNKKDITIASDSLTMGEIAEILSSVTGKKVVSIFLSRDEAVRRGLHPGTVDSYDWRNEVGSDTDIEALKKYGISLTSFVDWVRRHKDKIIIN